VAKPESETGGVRNRVSYQNLGKIPKLSQKPGFLDLGRSRGSQKPGFFPKFRWDAKIIAETRFLGFGAIARESETGFLLQISVRMLKLSQKPGFLDLGRSRCSQKPGFWGKFRWGCLNYRRNPVSWIWGDRAAVRNRVSSPNLGENAKIIAETRFLGFTNYPHLSRLDFMVRSGVAELALLTIIWSI